MLQIVAFLTQPNELSKDRDKKMDFQELCNLRSYC